MSPSASSEVVLVLGTEGNMKFKSFAASNARVARSWQQATGSLSTKQLCDLISL